MSSYVFHRVLAPPGRPRRAFYHDSWSVLGEHDPQKIIYDETGLRAGLRLGPNGVVRFIDLSSGAGVTGLGLGNEAIRKVISLELEAMPYAHSSNWTTRATEALADQIIGLVSDTLHKKSNAYRQGACLFLNSGAEAVEAACKIGIQFHKEIDQSREPVFMAREHSYHGNTLFTLALGDHPRKAPFTFEGGPTIVRFPAFLPSNESAEDGLKKLESTLLVGSKVIVVIEPIAGLTLGIEPATIAYLARLRDLCTKHGAVLIYDEVMSGNYRTGHLASWQYYQSLTDKDVAPDIFVLGKGLSGGYIPLSAVVCSDRIMGAVRRGSGRLWHSSTHQNHPVGCAAGFVALGQYIAAIPKINALSAHISGVVAPKLRRAPYVRLVDGVGTLWGVRLDDDNIGLHLRVREQAMKRGVAIYTDGGTINGRGNHILLAPPFVMPLDVLDSATDSLIEAIAASV